MTALAAGLATGCQRPAPFFVKDRSDKAERTAPWDPPNTYPEWAYDGPRGMKPAEDLQPEPRARPEDPLHYFTKSKLVPVRQPSGYRPEELPRITLWYTDNNGFEWKKAGSFGQSMSYFWFEAPGDGDYGVRFVGPGQPLATTPIAQPERVYHVDTTLPVVELFVEPNQAWYNPGRTVKVHWKATDYHLADQPVEIGMTLDFSAEQPVWTVLQKDLAAEGTFSYSLPAEAVDHGVVLRVAALDRAKNLGMAFTHTLQVVSEPLDENGMPIEEVAPTASSETPADDLAPTAAEAAREAFPDRGGAAAMDPAAGLAVPSGNHFPKTKKGDAGPIPPDLSWDPLLFDAGGVPGEPAPQSDKGNIPRERPSARSRAPRTAKPREPEAPPIRDLLDFDVLFGNEGAAGQGAPSDTRPPAAAPAAPRTTYDRPIPSGEHGARRNLPPVIARPSVTGDPGPHRPGGATESARPAVSAPANSVGRGATPPAAANPVPRSGPPGPASSVPLPAATGDSLWRAAHPNRPAAAATAPSLPFPSAAMPPLTLPPEALLAPLPGTVGGAMASVRRPWTRLDRASARDDGSIWLLPQPRFMDNTFGLFEMKYLSDNPEMIPPAPGADTSRPYAGIDDFADRARHEPR